MTASKIWLRTLVAGVLLAAATSGQASETVTLVHPTDPVFQASVWPILAGKVKSDKIDMQISFTSIPAVIQAVTTQQYDYVPIPTNFLPRLTERGLPIKIMCTNMRYSLKGGGSRLWVAANGPIKTINDLKGKTIGVTSLQSSGVTSMRVVLSKKYNVNVAFDGGDFKWVEMPLAVLPTALSSGRIEAAVLLDQYDYKAMKGADFRLLFKEGLNEALGAQVPGTVMLSYAPKLTGRPDAFVEANRMLKASAQYVHSHQDEVFGAVAKKNNIDPAYLEWYYENYADIPYDLTKGDLAGIVAFWGALKQLDMIKSVPSVRDMIWDRVTIE